MTLKQSNLPDKKKPIAIICPQKKEKATKHTKLERQAKDSQHTKSAAEVESNRQGFYIASVILLALGFAFINVYHVSTMFENDRHFSHLSNLEREMTFRTEMGLYYSYYKTLIEAPTFADGMFQILDDNVTEYPSVINTLKRFNLYPEVIVGAAFRMYTSFMAWLQIPAKQCWQVERGGGLKPVLSCEGLGDPMYFYLQAVWLCAGATAGLIFLFGTFLSESVLGGLISVLCFFFNHGESTRVQWTPPLRESFAYPALLLQMLSVSVLLRHGCSSWKQGMAVATATVLCLTTWQFSQFILATQVVVLMGLFAFGAVSKHSLILLLICVAAGVQHSLILLLGNELLASSFLVSLLLAAIFSALVLEPIVQLVPPPLGPLGPSVCLPLAGATSLLIRSRLIAFLGTTDDAHILNLLRAKLGSYKDFHTMLYTCSAEFDFLPAEYKSKLTETLLIPVVVVCLVAIVVYAFRSLHNSVVSPQSPPTVQSASGKTSHKQDKAKKEASGSGTELSLQSKNLTQTLGVEPELLYNFGQMSVFAIMALLVMRLKLLLTPHLCILASLLASRKYFSIIQDTRKHCAIVVVVLAIMSYKGVQNINEQRSIIGEYSNVGLEQLLEWVKAETPPDAVFAGPMPVMANLLLSTRRPIVNHPHYEDSGLRPGCSMTDVWDIEEPELKQQPPLCPRLFLQNPAPFERVFSNSEYVVLWLHSQYVELQPRREYKL
ncbi:hypothetical protein B566_EDAN000644 [Ephemera danica]|nr:hypothetical protein B566_EDAN000644 [Ephemera danica]